MIGLKPGLGAGAAVAAAVVLFAGPAAASGWTVVPVPPPGQPASLFGVSADSGSDAWAVGQTGSGFTTRPLADHWNGTSWQQVAVPGLGRTTVTLLAVSAASPTDAWALGRVVTYGNGYGAYHWDGAAWTPAHTPIGFQAVAVADIGPGNAWAAGSVSAGAGLYHWDGMSWTGQPFPRPGGTATVTGLGAIAANGGNDIWALGAYNTSTSCATACQQTFSLHFNGTSWNLVPMPPVDRSTDPNLDYVLTSAAAISPSDVWAAGYTRDATSLTPLRTLAEHWDGTAWSVVPAPSPGAAPALTGIAGSSPASVWAVGSDTPGGAPGPQTLTLFWNGTSWATVPSPHPGSTSTLNAVSTAPGTATVWAAGTIQPASSPPAPLVLRNG